MAGNFGAETDHFGFSEENFKVIESSRKPRPKNIADALDALGDYAKSQAYGDGVFEVTNTYQLCSGTLDTSTLSLGEVATGTAATSIVINTSNGEWPTIAVTGFSGLKAMVAPSGKTNKFKLPAWTLSGQKLAQELGFTVTGGELTSSSASCECQFHEANDGDGEPCAHGVSAGRATVSAEFVAAATTPGWTVEQAGNQVLQEPGKTEPQAAYHETDAQYYIDIARDGSE